MNISIGNRTFELLDRSSEGLTDSQRTTLEYLWNQTESRIEVEQVLRALKLSFPAPLQIRMEHLAKKGRLRELTAIAA